MEQWSGQEARVLRHALRLSVRDFAAVLGLPARTISRWEALGRGRTPRSEQQRMLDTVLERATPEQRTRFDEATADPDAQGVESPLRLVAVAGIRDEVRACASAYDSQPAHALLVSAAALRGRVSELQTLPASGAARRDLLAADAEVSLLAGQLIGDASQRRDHRCADEQFQRAAELASQIGDAITRAHALLRRSFIALYSRADPASGLTFATQAAESGRVFSPSLAGTALLHVAEAHAMLRDRRACEIALDEARQMFERRTDLDPAAEHYTPLQIRRMAGSCYLFLAEPAIAEGFLASARLELASPEKVGALVLGNLALSHIRRGQVDAATAVLHEAITVLECTRGGGGLNVVFKAGRELTPWRSDVRVHEVHDRLFDLLATA